MKYADEQVYLTFKTDRLTSAILKEMARVQGKSQPEFIEEICKDYIKMIETLMETNNNEQQTNNKP